MPAPHKSSNPPVIRIKNPFLEGQDRAYADILKDKMSEMRWWRLIVGGGVLILSALNFWFFMHAMGQQQTVPVLINVMPSGEAQYLGEVRPNTAAPKAGEASLQFQIRRFITNLRTVPLDPEVLTNNISECYTMVTSRYEPEMTKFLKSASPFDLFRNNTRRRVDIESVIKTTSSSWQVDWQETLTEGSTVRRPVKMRALVTLKLLEPTDETIRKNPLGIYIDNFEMAELQ